MKKCLSRWPVLLLLASIPLAVLANGADTPEQAVATQDLRTLQVPGKVANVVWTVRPERCTLQVVFPGNGRVAPVSTRPTVQAWLLRADGSAIESTGRSEEVSKDHRLPIGSEVLFAFPRVAQTEAVAVALSIDDKFLIERLVHP